MTIRVLMVHSRDGIGGSVITGALLASEGAASGRWSPTCICNCHGPVFDLHQRVGVRTIALSEAVGLPYTAHPGDANVIHRTFKRLFLIRAASRYLRSARPDIIHVHDESSALAWGLAAKRAGIPLLWHVHQQAPQRMIDWMLRRLARHVVFVSEVNRRRFRRPDRLPHSIIYNGVDLNTFRPRDEVGLHAPVVGFVSNLVDRKRPEWVIRAAGQLRREGVDIDVVLAGSDFTGGKKSRGLEDLARSEGLGEHCRFLGYRSDVAAILKQIDILTIPSMRDREALPRIIEEAMACGLPVVATRVAGIPEAVVHGETGLLVDPDDFASFTNALRSLALDPYRRRRFGAAGLARSRKLFSLKNSADAVDQLYRRLLCDSKSDN